jgi:hypothetical protein
MRLRQRQHLESLSALPITQNIGITLCQLQFPNDSKVLWVDAICIRQQDLAERSAGHGSMCYPGRYYIQTSISPLLRIRASGPCSYKRAS